MDPATILLIIKVVRLISGGVSLYEALHKAAPDLVPSFRDLALKQFPKLSFEDALHRMTREEEDRWFNKALGTW